MKLIIIFICKTIQFVLKKLHRGSSFPGMIALKLNHNIISCFKMPDKVVAVTGSSGKGSITSLTADISKKSGLKVATNVEGSNLTPGIVSMLLENSTITGKIKADIIIAEVDERYAKYVFPKLKPSHVVINNITRDQPPRHGHFDLVYAEIEKAISKDMHLILNADDPMLQKFSNNKITYYSIDKNKYSYKKNKFENLNFIYCPNCNHKLNYNYYNFEEIGDYYCPNCDFKKPKAKNIMKKIDYDKKIVTINNINIKVDNNILYNLYNTLAAYTLSDELDMNEKYIVDAIEEVKQKNIQVTNDRKIVTLKNKNENSSTFNHSLLYIDRDKDLKTIVIGWKEISRRYNFNDLSWLYDIDFEILTNHNIDKIVCVGLNRFDIAVRLKYANIDSKKIITFEQLSEAVNYIKEKTKGNIYGILNFDYVEPFNNLMGDDKND